MIPEIPDDPSFNWLIGVFIASSTLAFVKLLEFGKGIAKDRKAAESGCKIEDIAPKINAMFDWQKPDSRGVQSWRNAGVEQRLDTAIDILKCNGKVQAAKLKLLQEIAEFNDRRMAPFMESVDADRHRSGK